MSPKSASLLLLLSLPGTARGADGDGPAGTAMIVDSPGSTQGVALEMKDDVPDVLGQGPQVLEILVRGARPDVHIRVERADVGSIVLKDPGVGRLSGSFRSEPVRSAQIRIVEEAPEGENELYEGLLMLDDPSREVVAFAIVMNADRRRAARLPTVPSGSVEVVLDARVPYVVGIGWGLFVLGWTGLVAGMWRRR